MPGDREATYGALGEILREALGIAITDRAQKAQERLRLGLARLLGELHVADVEPTTFALATIAGIALPANPLENLPAAEVSDRLALAWPMLASACAATAPALFLIEDAHWARPELLGMVEHVVTRARGPIVVLMTARPELHEACPSFGTAGGDFSTIAIRPLGEVQSQELLDRLLVDDGPDPRVRRELLARAEGDPFYIEQLTHHMRSGGGSSTLPDTLQSLLAARLDALPVPERRVLQEAAVAGRTFSRGADPRCARRRACCGPPRRARAQGLRGTAPCVQPGRPGGVHVPARSPPRRRLRVALANAQGARARRDGSLLETLAGDRIDEFIDLLGTPLLVGAVTGHPGTRL